MEIRSKGTWHFVTADEDKAKRLIDFCNDAKVRLFAYSKHVYETDRSHWHFLFLFYRPKTLHEIAVLSNTAVSDPGLTKGSFVDHFNYLRSRGTVITNYNKR